MRCFKLFLIFILAVFLMPSCSDNEDKEISLHEPLASISLDISDLENRDFRNEAEKYFFSFDPKKGEGSTRSDLSDISDFVAEINNELYLLNEKNEFIAQLSHQLGVPDWSNTIEDEDQLLWVPLMKNQEITGLFGFLIINETLYLKPYLKDYLETMTYLIESDDVHIPLLVIDYLENGVHNVHSGAIHTRNCPPPPCGLVDVYDSIIDQWVNGVCVCASLYAPPGCCGGGNTGNELDGGAAEAGGYTTAQWIALVNAWFNRHNTTNTSNTDGGGTKNKKRVKLINDLANEQYILDWLLDYLGINIGEDGTNMELVLLLAGNPQITNPIYLYLNGYYTGVTVNAQNVLDLLDLLVDHDLNLGSLEIEHILTFEPELIADIQTFLDSHPNDPLALQIIHDFIDLQYCDTENPCIHTNYENRFEDYYTVLFNNPDYDFNYVISNKTDFNSYTKETWDSPDGPFAEHPIDDFDPDQTPWPTYGPVIDKADVVVHVHEDYDCHDFAKLQLAKSGYTISNYFIDHINKIIHYETIQVYKEFEDVDLEQVDNGLDYLYSALKRNIPVIVGVSTKPGSHNPKTDATTEHFVVIVGMGSDDVGNYFSFYDNASSKKDNAAHPDNKLYFTGNKFLGKSKASYAKAFTYRLAQIRKSKPK